MSLRDRLIKADRASVKGSPELFGAYGVAGNPFPASSQTSNNPRLVTRGDQIIEQRIESFIRDHASQVLVVEGTQGTGKTNVLNFYEGEIADIAGELSGFYIVRYLADPEASFEGTIRRLFQELGTEHLSKLSIALYGKEVVIEQARSVELRSALRKLASTHQDPDLLANTSEAFLDWLLGMRLLKSHRQLLGVNFRLDTVEAKTAALRDLIVVSSGVDELNGVFLLLDELEKQDGILSATAIVRYLSSLRALIDALPNHLFMMLAITPDALRRYGLALPAFRSRLNDRVTLNGLQTEDEALELAKFYLEAARKEAMAKSPSRQKQFKTIISDGEIRSVFRELYEVATKAGDTGLRQRSFLHALHVRVEPVIQSTS